MLRIIAPVLAAISEFVYSPSMANHDVVSKAHIQVLEAVESSKEYADASMKSEVGPELIYITALAEGLEQLLPGRDNIGKVDGFRYLGLNTFSTDAPALRSRGYLPASFKRNPTPPVIDWGIARFARSGF